MTPAELRLLRDLIRTIRASARGTGILGPAALNLANAVEVLAGDHGRVLTLLGDMREWIRSDVAGGACWPVDRFTRAELLARIDAELEGEK